MKRDETPHLQTRTSQRDATMVIVRYGGPFGAFALLFLLCFVSTVGAAPAVRFKVSNDPCLIQTCPGGHPPPPTTTEAGKSFEVFVVAVGADNQVDRTYTDPVIVTSSDAKAVLPPNVNFVPSDQGSKEFTAVLMTLGDQTIAVTDPVRGITGSLTMTVTAPAVAAVPVLGDLMKLLLISMLASSGFWLLRSRH